MAPENGVVWAARGVAAVGFPEHPLRAWLAGVLVRALGKGRVPSPELAEVPYRVLWDPTSGCSKPPVKHTPSVLASMYR